MLECISNGTGTGSEPEVDEVLLRLLDKPIPVSIDVVSAVESEVNGVSVSVLVSAVLLESVLLVGVLPESAGGVGEPPESEGVLELLSDVLLVVVLESDGLPEPVREKGVPIAVLSVVAK